MQNLFFFVCKRSAFFVCIKNACPTFSIYEKMLILTFSVSMELYEIV